jgi:hypothetical protein
MKGKTGLAAAGYAAAFAAALWATPIATIGGAAGIMVLSRALRSKPIMKVLSSPRLRAYEAEKALRAGAALGKRNIAAEKAWESARRSLRTILVDAGYYATDQGANVVEQEVVQPMVQQMTQGAAPAPQPAPPVQGPPTTAPRPDTINALYQAEINKLLGVSP